MKLTNWLAVAVGIIIALASISIFFPSDKERGRSLRFQLQWYDQAQFAGFYVAQARHYYDTEGLHVSITPGSPTIFPVRLVDSGEADIAVTPADLMLRAISEHKKIAAIGAVFDRSLVCYMSRHTLGIRAPKDLVGKIVGFYADQDTERVLNILLKDAGISKDTVDLRNVSSSALSAFETGSIPVWPSYRINEPLLMKQRGIEVDCLKPELFGLDYYSDTIVVNDDYLKKHGGAVNAFLRASAKGWRDAIEHPDEVVELMFKMGLNIDATWDNRQHQSDMLVEALKYVTRGGDKELLTIDQERMKNMENKLVELGVLSNDSIPAIDLKIDYNIARAAQK